MEEIRKISVNNEIISYILIRKRIKNMYLRIRDHEIVVTANARIPKQTVDLFVQKNADYIQKQLSAQDRQDRALDYSDGMRTMILGRERTVRFVPGKGAKYSFETDPAYVMVKAPSDQARNEKVYKKALQTYTEALLSQICVEYYPYLEPFGIPFPSVSFRRMTSRWGSCRPGKQAITLNTALIEVPREAIEYVVVHEFTHFLHPDHSARFYEAVARVLPDWKARRQLLKNIHP